MRSSRLSVAMVGTRGVPARYGGFETCVEEVGPRLVKRGFDVRVYCRRNGEASAAETYKGMALTYEPAVHHKALETITHAVASVGHLVRNQTDVAIVFNAANSPLVPAIRAAGVRVATHVDGLEWQRAKWGKTGRLYYRLAESMAVRFSDALIADAPGIEQYYRSEFDVPSELISYGAPVVHPSSDRLSELGIEPDRYHLVVARFEPENHILEMVQGYVLSGAKNPLIVVGDAPYANEYIRSVRSAADKRVRLLGSLWDQNLLDQLYSNATSYLHGHSVGGTNPSLLRAIGAGAAVSAFDVTFNRDVLGEAGRFFTTVADIAQCVELAECDPGDVQKRRTLASERAADYDWDDVADSYARLIRRLDSGELRRPHGVSGRRLGGHRASRATILTSSG